MVMYLSVRSIECVVMYLSVRGMGESEWSCI